MIRGHGIIINMSSMAPFTFTFNPQNIKSSKKINYAIAPNIGGAFKKRYFSGFDSKEISFQLHCVDMEGPTGVMEEISYFEQLREPDAGIIGGLLPFGNENYPPPQVLFQFGQSFLPVVWDVVEVEIEQTHFHAGLVRGVMGVPKRCLIDMKLALDESNIINKANMIAKKADMYAASADSVAREVQHHTRRKRKERPGIFPSDLRLSRMY